MSILFSLFSISHLFGLLGGGVLGFVGHMFNWHGKFGAAIKRVPSWAWIALAVVIASVAGYFYHKHQVNDLIAQVQQAQKAQDDAAWGKKLADAHTDAMNWKQQYETAQTTIANQERAQYENAVSDHAAIASALRLHGPGAASAVNCRPLGSASATATAGGHNQGATSNEAPGSPVPATDRTDQFAVVRWDWLTQVIQEHDDVISEAQAWRNQHQKQEELHAQQTAPVKR